MKQIFFTLGLMVISFGVFAQEGGGSVVSKAVGSVTRSRDFLMIQVSYDGWTGGPDSLKTGFNKGFNVALMYDFPIKKTHFSFAAGLGVSTSSVLLKNHELNMDDNTTNIPKFISSSTYKRYKVATSYLEIPLELRYRGVADNANKGFKAALGVKVGTLVNAHTKGKNTLGGERNIIKEQNKRFFNTWRFAATARVGYGNFALFGSYNLNPLFKDNSDLDIRPYSIGICLSGL